MKVITLLLFVLCGVATAAPPVISNIRASQRPGTKLVDVYYDLSDADGDAQLIEVGASSDAGLTYGLPCVTLSGDVGAGVAPGANRHAVWNAGADWDGNWVPECRVRVTAHDGSTPPAPPGMAFIPGGPFQMGDNLDSMANALPVHTVEVDGFFIDKTEVTAELWSQVKAWGNANGYGIGGGGWKAAGHPAHTVDWYEAVLWCNARSEMEGLTPCYYTDEQQTDVHRTGDADLDNTMVKWNANGYRLPTEAEWEKAARGGRTGQRYPWGNTTDTTEANYSYDGNPWRVGNQPYTSPVGSYPPNDYGVFGMAGNLSEWCWDRYASNYYGSPGSDENPPGPVSGSFRVLRSGNWSYGASYCRAAGRINYSPHGSFYDFGFRTVRR